MNHIVIDQDRTAARTGGAAHKEHTDRTGGAVKSGGSRIGESANAFALDLSGDFPDAPVYDGQGKTAQDIMREAGQTDVSVQKNYLAVMAATMSTEDFARLQEEGTPPGSTDIETVVTIIDEIKASLLKGGRTVAGYTDDLDAETLKEITGSQGLANEIVRQFHEKDVPLTRENVEDVLDACDRAAGLEPPGDSARKYMVANRMEPTVDNVYRAEHCAAGDTGRGSGETNAVRRSYGGGGYYQDESGYYARRAEGFDFEKLRPQMEKVIKDAGLAVTEDTLSAARWLVEEGMPLNQETLTSLCELRALTVPEDAGQVIAAAVAAVGDGRSARDASLTDPRTRAQKAADYVDMVGGLSGEAADCVAAEGKPLNLRNLAAAQQWLATGGGDAEYAVNEDARRQLEQVRLKMTVEASLRLLRQGIRIDTEELSRLVEELERAAQERDMLLFGGEPGESGGADGVSPRSGWYRDTLEATAGLPGAPAAVIGRFAPYIRGAETVSISPSDAFTLEGVYKEGKTLAAEYARAGESYETLMTAPRADLGDSIKKAFRNIDELLREMDMEPTEANRRAVRILGYNSMELSEENISAVKSADLTVRRVVEKMTPATTLRMIREGINPLSINMEELEAWLDRQEQEPEQDLVKYSRYLYQLEKNNGITEEERDSYIGIYRLFRQLQKTDGAAIGALVAQGAAPTVSNLLSAVRSAKKRGMDVTVDDSFGGVIASGSSNSISEQIAAGYGKKLAADIYDHLDGNGAKPVNMDQTLEELSETLRQTDGKEGSAADHRETARQQAVQMREAGKTEEAVIKELLSSHQPVTVDYLLAGAALLRDRGRLSGRMKELARNTGKEKELKECVERFSEDMGEEQTAKEAYGEYHSVCTHILEEAVYGDTPGNRIDLKEIRSLYKQISLAASLAREENYEVPVEIDGEMTSIHLKIIHDDQETGRVTASMHSERLGNIAAQFHLSEQADETYGLNGYIACDREETQKLLLKGEGLKKVLEQSDIKVNSLPVIVKEGLDPEKTLPTDMGGTRKPPYPAEKQKAVPSKKLYETAKAFIGYIRKGEGLQNENML